MKRLLALILVAGCSSQQPQAAPVAVPVEITTTMTEIMPEELRGSHWTLIGNGLAQAPIGNERYTERSCISYGSAHPYGEITVRRKGGQLVDAAWADGRFSYVMEYVPPNQIITHVSMKDGGPLPDVRSEIR